MAGNERHAPRSKCTPNRLETVGLSIPPELRARLLASGYKTTNELEAVGPVELAKNAGISHEEALDILSLLPRTTYGNKSGFGVSGAKTAWELLSYEKGRRRIVTLCEDLDRIVGGGFCQREVTEICGVPGVGKTQLGMQLAVNVQIPEEFGGFGGHAIYVDTEGSFMVERLTEIAEACILHLKHVAETLGRDDLLMAANALSVDAMLSNIYYFRVHDYSEQLALLHQLGNFLKAHSKVKLLLIDSITFHFRQDFPDMALRTRLLSSMSQRLMFLAEEYDLVVIQINQVTTRMSATSQARLVPALGESWSHACTNRLILFWAEGERHAFVQKSPSLKSATAPFLVTGQGIRGFDVEASKRARLE